MRIYEKNNSIVKTRYRLHPPTYNFAVKLATGKIGTGISSRSLARYALGQNPELNEYWPSGRISNRISRPYDKSDYDRCMVVYNAAPNYLKRIMYPVLAQWCQDVNDGKYFKIRNCELPVLP